MARWRTVAGAGWLVTLAVLAGPVRGGAAPMAPQAPAGGALDPAYLDKLLAPVALFQSPRLRLGEFESQPPKDFCNNIGAKRALIKRKTTSAKVPATEC